MLSVLPLREREIVQLRFGIGTTHDHTLEEIGEKFSLSRERIRQILEAVLLKLRRSTQVIPLKEFMEMN
jgi:RNA polymerase primary sigma factor